MNEGTRSAPSQTAGCLPLKGQLDEASWPALPLSDVKTMIAFCIKSRWYKASTIFPTDSSKDFTTPVIKNNLSREVDNCTSTFGINIQLKILQ